MFKRFLNRMGYYKINEFQAGGHCGCCGVWIPDQVLPKEWSWGLCEECNRS